MLSELLTSNSRAQIMGILFSGNNEERYLRELEKLSGIKVNSLQKEVKHLCSLDLLKSRKDGNRIYYSANQEHPLYPDLVSIVEKTIGVIGQLKTRLSDNRIDCAFLFGSFVNGKTSAISDLDLIIIGDLGMRELSKNLSGLQEKIGREINPHIFSNEEFRNRIKENDHFLTSVLRKEIKVIKGNLDEFR